ncbi:unnamed protein product [Notodromas monacha]|uniref:Cytochrome P450 n=1 Tax=Notodromas monacha TaxID=399045 RepID=A0A7R9GHG2_9CRUS|nr:unnamed protein product [Notodromas monacha]CAG0921421.1 unnamed protein product [Notodromas monacha]
MMTERQRCWTPKALPMDSGSFFTGERGFRLFTDVADFVESKVKEHKSRIFQTRVLLKPTAIVVSNSAVAALLFDDGSEYELGYDDYFKRLFGDTLFLVEGPEAKLLRESLRPLFAESMLQSYQVELRERMRRPLADLAKCPRVNVYKYFKAQSMALCLDVFLGSSPNGASAQLKEEIAALVSTHWHGVLSIPLDFKFPMLMSSAYRKAVDAREKLVKLILRRLRESDDGFLGCLKSTKMSEELQVQFLLLAVSALIPKAFASLMTSFFCSSEHWQPLVDDDGIISDENLSNVLLEVLRLYPPFMGGRRVAKRDTVLDTYLIPRGTPLVYINMGAHTDPAVFPDPHCFRPFRWKHENSGDQRKLFTFGGGARTCIGYKLIFSGWKMICRILISEFTWEVDRASADVKLKYLPVLRPKDPLYVKFRPR